jgi:hypothetical protein
VEELGVICVFDDELSVVCICEEEFSTVVDEYISMDEYISVDEYTGEDKSLGVDKGRALLESPARMPDEIFAPCVTESEQDIMLASMANMGRYRLG